MTQKYNISQCFKRKIILCACKSDWRRYVHRNMLDFDDKRRWFWIQERKKLKISQRRIKLTVMLMTFSHVAAVLEHFTS